MDHAILVDELIDAGREFADAFNAYFAVDVLFWLNPADSADWQLCLASQAINDGNLEMAYGEVLQLVGGGKQMWLDAFQIKLFNANDPLAKKVKEIRDRHAVPLATRYNGTSIAGVPISGAYIYPPLKAIANVGGGQ